MKRVFIAMVALLAGCAGQAAQTPSAAIAQSQAGTVQLMRVQPVATTATGQLAQAVDPADCVMLGMSAPSMFITSSASTVSALNPFIGAILAKFACTVIKGWLSPPAETIAVQNPVATSGAH